MVYFRGGSLSGFMKEPRSGCGNLIHDMWVPIGSHHTSSFSVKQTVHNNGYTCKFCMSISLYWASKQGSHKCRLQIVHMQLAQKVFNFSWCSSKPENLPVVLPKNKNAPHNSTKTLKAFVWYYPKGCVLKPPACTILIYIFGDFPSVLGDILVGHCRNSHADFFKQFLH